MMRIQVPFPRLIRGAAFAAFAACSIALVLAACSAGQPGTPPGSAGVSAGGSIVPSASTAPTEDQAVALVLARNSRFAGVGRHDPELIGQANWYEVRSLGTGFQVTVHVGWGDCPAGCLYGHSWQYVVDAASGVRLASESGDELPPETLGVAGTVTAEPVCPVEHNPPDPSCAPRAVAGAILVVVDVNGHDVAHATSATDGTYRIQLPPGAYQLVPGPVTGLQGTPAAIPFQVKAEDNGPVRVDVAYDTGIA